MNHIEVVIMMARDVDVSVIGSLETDTETLELELSPPTET